MGLQKTRGSPVDARLHRIDAAAIRPSNTCQRQDSPYPHVTPNYGAKKQYAEEVDASPPLDKEGTRRIQQINGKFLFLGRAIDSTVLKALGSLGTQQAEPTEETNKRANQLIDYLVSQEEAVLTFRASNMVLAVHSDASYLSETKARSCAGGHFFLSNDEPHPPNNGAILTIAQVIKSVMSSASEAELAALFINAREAVHIRNILAELGHSQPRTPVQTDNATAEALINGKILPKRLKAMDMRFHWLRDRAAQMMFRFYWRPGTTNWADYFTKHHAPSHHKNVRGEYLTPQHLLQRFKKERQESQ